jgi:hypothetical protein
MAVQYAFGKIVTQGLDLALDAADPTSYPGSGNTWTSVVNRSITGSLVSCSYSSDFKGGIVFNNPSASVQLPGTVANYGTGSFTIEMAFRPTQIQGIHYLISKNSGSFPNWGVYLSGSGGSGKLFAEYRISSTVSCSVSSSTTFVTGSNYFVDVIFDTLGRRVYINNEGNYDAVSELANGTGSLTTTGSLFIGNLLPSSSQAYSGSIFNTKIYSIINSGYNNFKSIAPRVSKPIPARASSALALIVAGGGGGAQTAGNTWAGGGGAGGLILSTIPLTQGIYTVNVGAGGGNNTNGQTSSIAGLTALGGGRGGRGSAAGDGGSGGGGGDGGSSGLGTLGQGNNGGGGSNGGGGGAGSAGTSTSGGSGSFISLFSTIGGSPEGWFAGGGAGALVSIGGIGGGGNIGITGSANTGGGGGAGPGGFVAGKNGGSGIIAIRYPGPPIATGGTITSVGGDTIHTFTATGSSTFTVF